MLCSREIFQLFVVFGCVMGSEEMRLCPSCLDDDYVEFFGENLWILDNRDYKTNYNLAPYQCLENSFILTQCDHSCIRIHLAEIGDIKNETVGWFFDCSTDIIRVIPETLTDVTTSFLRRFDGDLQFLDFLNKTFAFEIQFYSVSYDVEKPKEFYSRQHVIEMEKLHELQKCQEYPNICFFRKVAYDHSFFSGVSVMLLVFLIGKVVLANVLKHCHCQKSDNSAGSAEYSNDAIALEEMDTPQNPTDNNFSSSESSM